MALFHLKMGGLGAAICLLRRLPPKRGKQKKMVTDFFFPFGNVVAALLADIRRHHPGRRRPDRCRSARIYLSNIDVIWNGATHTHTEARTSRVGDVTRPLRRLSSIQNGPTLSIGY